MRYYTSPWIPSRPHCRKWIALFSGTACVFRLMFFAAQRVRLPFTAMPSRPHGARSAILHFTPKPSPRPLCLTRAGQRACNRSQAISVRPRPILYGFAMLYNRQGARHFLCGLCHGLCHNPAIPARVGPSLAVSLRHTQKAVNTPETRMDTTFLCRRISLVPLPYQCTRRFDTEEVAGSSPVVPTI